MYKDPSIARDILVLVSRVLMWASVKVGLRRYLMSSSDESTNSGDYE
jgi:hypothetical protein